MKDKMTEEVVLSYESKKIKAYGATYGAGISPEAVPDLLKALVDVAAYEERCRARSNPMISEKWYNQIKAAIEKAQIK